MLPKLVQIKKAQEFISYGWRYDPDEGIIYSHKNKPWSGSQLRYKKYGILYKPYFAFYFMTGDVPEFEIIFKDGNKKNYKWENLGIRKDILIKANGKPEKKFEDLTPATQLAYRSKKPERVPKGFEFPSKPVKNSTRIIKTKPKSLKIKVRDKKKNTKHIQAIEMYYEVIISKAKGKVTPKLDKMFILLVTELSRKFWYERIKDDTMQEALLHVYKSLKKFDEKRYNEDKVFAYFTEVAKRGMVKGYKDIQWQTFCGKPKLLKYGSNL